MNSPNRSTSESVGGRPSWMTANRPTSAMPTSQATQKPAQATSRGTSGRKALATTSGTAAAMPAT